MSQSLFSHRASNAIFLLLIASTCFVSSGCSTLSSLTSQPLPVGEAVATESSLGSYSVEMHPNFGSPKQYKGQLLAGSTVSDALEKAGAIKKFRSMDIEILRKVEKNGKTRGLRMPVNYETQLKGPRPEQDYALLDGDRIVIKPTESGSLMKMVGAMMGSR